jgi:hypothetical protein
LAEKTTVKKMLNTKNLNKWPDRDLFVRRCRSVAILDAILAGSPQNPEGTYDLNFGQDGADFIEFRDGSGNQLGILITKDAVLIHGIDHDSSMAPGEMEEDYNTNFKWLNEEIEFAGSQPWNGLFQKLPKQIEEPLKKLQPKLDDIFYCSFFVWNIDNKTWQTGVKDFEAGEDPDGSGWILAPFFDFDSYFEHALFVFEDIKDSVSKNKSLIEKLYNDIEHSDSKDWLKLSAKVDVNKINKNLQRTLDW